MKSKRTPLLLLGASLAIWAVCNQPGPAPNPSPTPSANRPPTVSLGADQSVDAGASVTLDGSASSDPDGDALTFIWTQKRGTPVSLSSKSEPVVTFTAPSNGTALSFELKVSDGQDEATGESRVSVRPVNPSVEIVELRQRTTVRDDPAVQDNLPESYEVGPPLETPAARREGGAFALFESTQFAPQVVVQLAPGATHEVELQLAGPSVLLGSAKWIGTTDRLSLSVSLDGTSLANGGGFVSGPDRGGSSLRVSTATGGLAKLSVTNTSSATVDVQVVFGALGLDLVE